VYHTTGAVPETMGERREINRDRIIGTANELFYKKGFNETSFTDIANASGLPRGNFYYYFKTKDEILRAVIDYRLARIRKTLATWQSEFDNPRDRLQRFITMLLNEQDKLVRYGCPMGSLSVELRKDQPELQTEARHMFDAFLDFLETQFKALGSDAVTARQQAQDLLARAQGITVVASAYNDRDFLRRSAKVLRTWVNDL